MSNVTIWKKFWRESRKWKKKKKISNMSMHSKDMRLWNLKFPAILLLKIAQNGNFLSVCPLGVRSFTFSSQAHETMEVTEPCLLHYKSGQVKINLSQNNLIEQIGHRRENCTRQNSSQAPLKYWNYWLKLKKKLNLLVTTHWLPIPSSLPGHAVGKKTNFTLNKS